MKNSERLEYSLNRTMYCNPILWPQGSMRIPNFHAIALLFTRRRFEKRLLSRTFVPQCCFLCFQALHFKPQSPFVSSMLKALLVDDERLARTELRRVLAEFPDRITVIGEAANKQEAVRFIAAPENLRPNVMFLDINMPRGSGFDVLQDIDYEGERPIHIVFVTAYNKYAVRAFSVNALDYLLKPVDARRIEKTLERIQKMQNVVPFIQPVPQTPMESIAQEEHDDDELSAEEEEQAPREYSRVEAAQKLTLEDFIFVTIGKTMRFVPVPELVCVRSNGNYSELLLKDGKRTLILRTMNEWEDMLPPTDFLRIHRATIVNRFFFDSSRSIETLGRAAQLYLRGIDEPLLVSRRYLAKLKDRLP